MRFGASRSPLRTPSDLRLLSRILVGVWNSLPSILDTARRKLVCHPVCHCGPSPIGRCGGHRLIPRMAVERKFTQRVPLPRAIDWDLFEWLAAFATTAVGPNADVRFLSNKGERKL